MPLDFTEEQKAIFHFVEHDTANAIIDAVAGAGKTTTIMECAKFVADKKAVLFCAFNNSIASEIAQKFRERNMNDVTVNTIHSLGWQILRGNDRSNNRWKLDELKYQKLIETEDVQEKLKHYVEKITEINGFDQLSILSTTQKFALNDLAYRIKARLIEMNQKFRATLTEDGIEAFEILVLHYGIFNEIDVKKQHFKDELACYYECHKILLEAGDRLSERTMVIDFTDMLYLPCKWNLGPVRKFDFLFIDECQDLSRSQLDIALKYKKEDGRIIAVGDPRQSIYGFTGADINSFYRVKERANATQLPLTTCFRCPQKVIGLAQVIRPDIVGSKEEDGIVNSVVFDEVVGLSKPGDLVISRLRAPLVLLVFAYIELNIKVHIDKDEVNEIINEIKSIFKPSELELLIPGLANEFETLKGDVLYRYKWLIQKKADRITDSIERDIYVANETLYLQQKLDFLGRRYEAWKKECTSLNAIMQKIKEFISATRDSVKLSTIHRAKGLENERVFILNYDALPFHRTDQKDWQKTQELNLKYVAITRAKSELFLIENKEEMEEGEGLFDHMPSY